jgi:hypothetical protein
MNKRQNDKFQLTKRVGGLTFGVIFPVCFGGRVRGSFARGCPCSFFRRRPGRSLIERRRR